jgi:hypothetical protein
MNCIPRGLPEYVRLLARYPLKVGDTWSYTREFDNPTFQERGDAKVVAYESITVPAETFDCFRVNVKAEFSNRSDQRSTRGAGGFALL